MPKKFLQVIFFLFPLVVYSQRDFNDPKKGKGGCGTPDDCSCNAGNKNFEDEYFRKKGINNCWQISETGCNTVHEAMIKCECYCTYLAKHPGQVPPGRDFVSTAAPAPVQTPAPTAATSAPSSSQTSSSGGNMGCFHGDGIVQTKQGPVTVRSLVGNANVEILAVNDRNELMYSPVRYWVHAESSKSANFITLETSTGHKVSLTREHLIYTFPCETGAQREPIFAERLQVGQCVLVKDYNNTLKVATVTSRSESEKVGVYSPITAEGSIIVDGVAASCFSYVENEALQMIVYGYVDSLQALLKMFLPESLFAGIFGSTVQSHVNVPSSFFSFFEFSKSFLRSD